MAEAMDSVVAKRDRSPSFPYIGLDKALERTRELFAKAKHHFVFIGDAAGAWGLGPKSSSTQQTVGALIAFGLLEDTGSGESRKVKVSDVARRILEDARPGVRESLLAEVALKPRLIAEYAEKWRDGRPDDKISISQLKFDSGFLDDGAAKFLRVFDETMTYAKRGSYLSAVREESEVGVEERPVLADATEIPAVQVVDAGPGHTAVPRAELLSLETGEREWLRGPLSKHTSYRLVVTGEMGPKEIGKLIKLLEAQKLILSDDDEDEFSRMIS